MEKKDLTKFIKVQMNLAKKQKLNFINKIELSPLQNKKYRVYLNDGSHVDYGAFGMEDYLIHKDKIRRERFHNRFHNNKGYNDPKSGLFYSRFLLW